MNWHNFRNFAGLVIVIALGALVLLWPTAPLRPDFPHDHMTVKRADGQSFDYNVEVATTSEQEMYGLMFRKAMPAGDGMVFVYDPPRDISMWMKNTLIPLDMLFVRSDGTIVKIITHAVPQDLTPLPAGQPVKGVVELNAGDVQKHNFKTGDKVLFSGFSN